MRLSENMIYEAHWQVRKYSEEAVEFCRRRLALPEGMRVTGDLLSQVVEPDMGLLDLPGNLLLNEGIQELLLLGVGFVSSVSYNNANAQIGVGDSNTAAAATQTDLQAATNKLYVGMDATFPSLASQTMTWQSTFSTSQGNYAWEEASLRNGASRDKNLNRKVSSMGTKTSIGTWVISLAITIS